LLVPILVSTETARPELILLKEIKISKLIEMGIGKKKFEASGVISVGEKIYTVFDNYRSIGVVEPEWIDSPPEEKFILNSGVEEIGWEGISFHPTKKTLYVVSEAEDIKDGLFAFLYELNDKLEPKSRKRISLKLKKENKGIEGIAFIQKDKEVYLIALCEVKNCSEEKGIAFIMKEEGPEWKKIKSIDLPFKFQDYSDISVKGNDIAVLSQEDSTFWLGKISSNDVLEAGKIYPLPRNEDGSLIYCNAEGIHILDNENIMIVSDKLKAWQSKECKKKSEMIHLFRIQNN
jgi:uncharacterized protein YjiK